MKKIISLAFAVAALSVVLAGCSKGEDATTTTPPAEGTTNSAPTGTTTPTTPN